MVALEFQDIWGNFGECVPVKGGLGTVSPGQIALVRLWLPLHVSADREMGFRLSSRTGTFSVTDYLVSPDSLSVALSRPRRAYTT